MNYEEKMARDLARLEEAQRKTQERLAQQQDRIDKRFERIRERLTKKYGEPNDSQLRIISAALELLSDDGLDNLSLRKLASRVDMQASALYWHFKSKEVLVDYMAEAILVREFKDLQPRQEDETWQDWLSEQMVRLRRAMLAFPDGGRVVAGAHICPAVTLGKLFEQTMVSLYSAGINLQTARNISMTVTNYTFGFVIEEQAGPSEEEIAMLAQNGAMSPYPKLMQAMQEAHRDNKDLGNDYIVGLQYIIDGASK